MSYSESVFNQNLVHPCLYSTATLAQTGSRYTPYYVPREEPLNATNEQLKTVADRYSYASVESFQKLKLYYIQTSDKYTCVKKWLKKELIKYLNCRRMS
jgi:hypothetical protein